MRTVRHVFAGIAATFVGFPSFAQVPPDIAAGIREIGPVPEMPETMALYAPLFADQNEPYTGVTVSRDVAYGADPLQDMDVFTAGPGGGARPVFVYAHGGGFRGGDKREPDSPFYDNIMLWAVDNGMVGVNVNYRLYPQVTWPAANDDLAAALEWVRAHIADHGGDPGRIFIVGQSAGAALVAAHAAFPQFWDGNTPGIAGVVMLSGIYDASILEATPYFEGADPGLKDSDFVIDGLKKAGIPLFVSHTEVDAARSIAQSKLLQEALCDAGRCPASAEFEDHSHNSQVFSFGTADTSVSDAVLAFIRGAD